MLWERGLHLLTPRWSGDDGQESCRAVHASGRRHPGGAVALQAWTCTRAKWAAGVGSLRTAHAAPGAGRRSPPHVLDALRAAEPGCAGHAQAVARLGVSAGSKVGERSQGPTPCLVLGWAVGCCGLGRVHTFLLGLPQPPAGWRLSSSLFPKLSSGSPWLVHKGPAPRAHAALGSGLCGSVGHRPPGGLEGGLGFPVLQTRRTNI